MTRHRPPPDVRRATALAEAVLRNDTVEARRIATEIQAKRQDREQGDGK